MDKSKVGQIEKNSFIDVSKKILLISDLHSPYTMQFIEEVLKPLGFSIFMQIPSKNQDNEYNSFLEKNNITLIKFYEKDDNLLFKLPCLGLGIRIILNLLELRKFKDFDIIHVQFVTIYSLIRAFISKKYKTKICVSFWGSDLLRRSDAYLQYERRFLTRVDYISTAALLLQKKLYNIYPNLKVNTGMVPFGVSSINYIDKYYNDKDNCKDYFSLPKNKKIVAIGYNSIRQQQHDKVINAIKNLENKDHYCLVFQMTYGHDFDKDYIDNLYQLIDESGFEYKIFKSFLSMEDLAKLRTVTDIFINAQTTDAFANSVIENIYAKTQIINAGWLHYPEIDEFALHVNEFNNFNEIPELLNKVISDEELEWNKKKIKEITTWKSCRDKWAEIYDVK